MGDMVSLNKADIALADPIMGMLNFGLILIMDDFGNSLVGMKKYIPTDQKVSVYFFIF